MSEVVLLAFGQQDKERFLLHEIKIGDNFWPVHQDFIDPLVVPIGHELVIRQEGHTVKIIRRMSKP